MKKILLFAFLFLSISAFSQVRVQTLSGTTTPSIYMTNNYYNNGPGNASTYLYPNGVAIASTGTSYGFDSYVNVIRKIGTDGYTSQFCGNSSYASPSFSSGYADGNSTTAQFSNITAITVDKLDNILVMDFNRIRKITPSGNVTTITTNTFEFKNAQGITTDVAGNIYVSDTGNKRVRKVSPTGVITTIATGFTCPKGITIDAAGNLYVSDSSVVKKITPAGVVSVYATGFGGASGIAIDTNGEIYVADSLFSIIYKVSTSGVVTNYAGSGIANFRDGLAGQLRTSASFYNPEGLAIDVTRRVLLVADRNSQRIRIINLI